MLSTVLTALTLSWAPSPQSPALPQEADLDPAALAEVAEAPAVETLFVHGGRIYLGNAEGSAVEALLVENGRVVQAGTEQALRAKLPEVGVSWIDLKGAVAVPGIQDGHVRIERFGADLERLDLRGVASYEELVERVAERAKSTPAGQWVLGHGWDQRLWEGGELPHHAALSVATPEHPVLLWRVDGSSCLVNAKALELAELHEELGPLQRVQGGRILRDESDFATGVLLDEAARLVTDRLPAVEAAEREARLLRAQEELLARGITCAHDMGVAPETLAVYESLRERGLLKLRVVAYVDGNRGLDPELAPTLPRAPDGLGLFSVPGVFYQLDGDLGTRSAALLQDYVDAPGERGQLRLDKKRLSLLVNETSKLGLQPAVQAAGDLANRVALDVFDLMMTADENFPRLRPRVEHAQVISSRDIPRFPELKVIPSMLPTQTLADFAWLEGRLGTNRSRGTYAWRSLAPGLMQLAFGTGLPFEDGGPLEGIYAARMRRDHESLYNDGAIGSERLDGLGALAGFTRGPARAAHQEKERGQLVPGYWADLTVFDRDPIEGDPETLRDARVLLTVINGRVVWSPGG